MRTSFFRACCGAWALALLVGGAAVADWPQWRGPAGNGSAPEAETIGAFSLEPRKNVRWVADLPGPSAATPVVVGHRVFLTAFNKQTGKLAALAIDAATGERQWAIDVAEGVDASGRRGTENYLAEPSPAADGERVVFLFGTGDLLATDHDGNVLWRVNLVERFGPMQIMFGYAASPLLVGDRVYVVSLRRNDPAYLACFDANDGSLVFRHDRATSARAESREAYTTPLAATIDGDTHIVVHGSDALTGHDPSTGDELWRYEEAVNPTRQNNFRAVAGPVQGDDGTIYVTAPRGKALLAVRVTQNVPTLAWETGDIQSDVATPAFFAGHLYVLNGEKKSLSKLTPAGQVVWTQPLDASTYCRASPTVAGGHVYAISAEGELFIVADGDEPGEPVKIDLASYPTRASIAASGDALYIRTAGQLICAAAD